jgi:hypothetical protein
MLNVPVIKNGLVNWSALGQLDGLFRTAMSEWASSVTTVKAIGAPASSRFRPSLYEFQRVQVAKEFNKVYTLEELKQVQFAITGILITLTNKGCIQLD